MELAVSEFLLGSRELAAVLSCDLERHTYPCVPIAKACYKAKEEALPQSGGSTNREWEIMLVLKPNLGALVRSMIWPVSVFSNNAYADEPLIEYMLRRAC